MHVAGENGIDGLIQQWMVCTLLAYSAVCATGAKLYMGGQLLSLLDFEPVPQEGIHAWYCKHDQNPDLGKSKAFREKLSMLST